MTVRRVAMAVTMAVMMVAALVPSAFANGTSTQDQLDAHGWGCAAEVGLPAGHCISPGTVERLGAMFESGSGTFQLLVFDEQGNFVTAEVATFMSSADARPCPHDGESPDGTYWDFVPGYLWVCHHQSE